MRELGLTIGTVDHPVLEDSAQSDEAIAAAANFAEAETWVERAAVLLAAAAESGIACPKRASFAEATLNSPHRSVALATTA
jgi:hypothetical protein